MCLKIFVFFFYIFLFRKNDDARNLAIGIGVRWDDLSTIVKSKSRKAATDDNEDDIVDLYTLDQTSLRRVFEFLKVPQQVRRGTNVNIDPYFFFEDGAVLNVLIFLVPLVLMVFGCCVEKQQLICYCVIMISMLLACIFVIAKQFVIYNL